MSFDSELELKASWNRAKSAGELVFKPADVSAAHCIHCAAT